MDAILKNENRKPDSLTEIVVPESQNYELKVKYGFRRPFARGSCSPIALGLYTVLAMSEAVFLIAADHFNKYNYKIEIKPFLISSAVAGLAALTAFTYYHGRQMLDEKRKGNNAHLRTPTEIIFYHLLNSKRARDRD